MALTARKRLFLYHYLDQANPKTFLRVEAAALAAGYSAKTAKAKGYKLRRECEAEIARWLDEDGLADTRLKEKLLQLLDAKETKFFQKDGVVTEVREVEALHIQKEALKLGCQLKGWLVENKQADLQPLPWSD